MVTNEKHVHVYPILQLSRKRIKLNANHNPTNC